MEGYSVLHKLITSNDEVQGVVRWELGETNLSRKGKKN